MNGKRKNRIIENTKEKYWDDYMNGRLTSEQEEGYRALFTGPPDHSGIRPGEGLGYLAGAGLMALTAWGFRKLFGKGE